MLLTGNDIDGDLAERYGYVNRSIADADLEQFVDALAGRISKFDKQTIADIKGLVNSSTLPSNEDLKAQWGAFIASAQRPQAQERVQQLIEMGLQKKPDVERRLAEYTGKLGEASK